MSDTGHSRPVSAFERTLSRLTEHHDETVTLARRSDEATLRTQYHPMLSPLGWHAGHCSFIETLWVQSELLGDHRQVRRWQALYQPDRAYKPERGLQLPSREALIDWCCARHAENMDVLADPPRRVRTHPLLRGAYLPRFLLQHYAQHLETMDYVRAQRSLVLGGLAPTQPTPPGTSADPRWAALPPGRYAIGCDEVDAYDNEQPARSVDLPGAWLSRRVVTNDAYLAFVEDGGYHCRALWDEAGWLWCRDSSVDSPLTWGRDGDGGLWQLTPDGWVPYQPLEAVAGLSHFEAAAFARWAGARLPHEYEWEAARRQGLLADAGRVWEWCGNSFHPYPGFRSFPYQDYSTPWFDGGHFVLRGASALTRPAVIRPSFRNFYTREVRHAFAGLRLALDL